MISVVIVISVIAVLAVVVGIVVLTRSKKKQEKKVDNDVAVTEEKRVTGGVVQPAGSNAPVVNVKPVKLADRLM